MAANKARKVSAQDPSDEFDGLAAPARRALANAGYTTLSKIARISEAEIAALHGMGPNAIKLLRQKLAASGTSFAKRK